MMNLYLSVLTETIIIPNPDNFIEGQPASLSCMVNGTEPFAYTWTKDGTSISHVQQNLVFHTVMRSDSGLYVCEGENKLTRKRSLQKEVKIACKLKESFLITRTSIFFPKKLKLFPLSKHSL